MSVTVRHTEERVKEEVATRRRAMYSLWSNCNLGLRFGANRVVSSPLKVCRLFA